jgi:hypothetical protein
MHINLYYSALELTCRAPKTGICGGGSTLSEYELYFNYARVKFPETVALRPLMWANGPSPGLLFWPKQITSVQSDGKRDNWMSHRQNEGIDLLLFLCVSVSSLYIILQLRRPFSSK